MIDARFTAGRTHRFLDSRCDPLSGMSPAQVVSQLAHRVFGPLHLERTRVVLEYHFLGDRAARTLAEPRG
jgi:hypothetical protein